MSDRIEEQVLDLDELYGVAKPLIVTWGGERYALKRPEGMGPEELTELQRMQREYNRLNQRKATLGSPAAPTSKQEYDAKKLMRDIDKMVTQIIAVFSPELGKAGLPFGARVKILQFYINETQAKTQSTDNDPNLGAQ